MNASDIKHICDYFHHLSSSPHLVTHPSSLPLIPPFVVRMKSAAVVVALVALVVAVAAGFPSSAAAQELRASTGRQLLALEPSQVFLIACLTIGGFVLIVALLACIVVANRYGGVVEEETRQEKMAQQGNYSTAVVYTDTQATPAQVRKTYNTHNATKTKPHESFTH